VTAQAKCGIIDAVFVFIGTKPRSNWLPDGVLREAGGFVITGRDLADCFDRNVSPVSDLI
jgi:hypothetical protein